MLVRVNSDTELWGLFCFICNKNFKIDRKSFQSKRNIRCPECNRKEAVITHISKLGSGNYEDESSLN